jgi:ureidoglycolate dehydrogenase (NAD+)
MDRPQGTGHWMLAMNISDFMPLAAFQDRMGMLVDMVRATRPRVDDRPVLLPGEPEELTSAARSRDGIPLPDDTVGELVALSDQYGVPIFAEKR